MIKKLGGVLYRRWRKARRYALERWMTERYELVEMEGYAAEHALPATVLAEQRVVRSDPPIFFGGYDRFEFGDYDGTEIAPRIAMIEFEDVWAVGRTEFILKGGKALYPGIIKPSVDAFMMELEKRGSVDVARGIVNIWPRHATLSLPTAISLLGQCNGNYAHWVTEVLARFAFISERPEFAHLPILVDHPVHEKLVDALDFLNVRRHEVIEVLPYQKVHVDRLVYLTPPSMTPPETRDYFESGTLAPPRSDQFHFSDLALGKLRQLAVPMAKDCLTAPKMEAPWFEFENPRIQRIYLKREARWTGNGRLLRNHDVVEAALQEFGFQPINIADHSFEGQVLAVQDALIVASPIGAALSNLVFCKPGCIVIIFSPVYYGATYYYFANLMASLGHTLLFVVGPQTRHGGATVYNRDFRISIKDVRSAVQYALQLEHERRIRKS